MGITLYLLSAFHLSGASKGTGKLIPMGSQTPPPPLYEHVILAGVEIFLFALCYVCGKPCKCLPDSQLGSDTDLTFLIRGVDNSCQN